MSVALVVMHYFCPLAIVCLLLLSVRYRFFYTFSLRVYQILLICIFVPLAKRLSVLLVAIYFFWRFAIGLFSTFVSSLLVCLHVVLLYSEMNVRFASGVLLILSVRCRFVYFFDRSLSFCFHFFPVCLSNLLFGIFVPVAKRMSALLVIIYYFRPFAIGLCTSLSVRYRFVCKFSRCVYIIWLFCIFVPVAKGMAVSLVVIWYFRPFAIGLFTSLSVCYRIVYKFSRYIYLIWLFCIFVLVVKRLSVSLSLSLSVRYRFIYMFSPCIYIISFFCIFVPLTKRTSLVY